MEPKGKKTFYCPFCGQKLSFLNGTVIKMVGRMHATTFSCKTMLYVNANLGEYGIIVGEGVRVYDGAKIELECINSGCKKNFTTSYNDELAQILMKDSAGNEFRVVFNKIFGKRATFVLDMEAHKVVESFGDAADEMFKDRAERGRNFFGE